MSPQKFVKTLPPGYTERKAPTGFKRLKSLINGFLIISEIGNLRRDKWVFTEHVEGVGTQDNTAVRLPDGRLVIPTIKGEKRK